MDILISSNLERQLSHIAGTEAVAEWMEQLKTCGRFEVGEEIRAKLAEEYAAGSCTAEDAADEISVCWQEKAYLMDTHTAVASRVLREYRKASGDNAPAVIVSTASPYKFCDAVLRALGESVEVPGTELLHKLEEKTGWKAPAPLSGLKNREIRFSEVIAKEQMISAVDRFLQ
jgi:threonine synthase